jgi:septal ring factor EnvC (AmiA/AmiB activator)
MKLRLSIIVITLLLPGLAMAETAPVPAAHPVKELEQKLEAEKARSLQIEKEMKGIKSTLDDTRGKLVSTAAAIKKNEGTLSQLEKQIDDMNTEQIEIEGRLGKDKGAIADLVLALERLRRVPPEAVLARPGAPLQTAQSAMILESTLPRIYGRAESLRHDLERLKEIIAGLEDKKSQAQKAAHTLEEQQTEMAALLQKRERLYNQTAADKQANAAEIKRISTQASNLKDLVKKLEEREKEKQRAREDDRGPARKQNCQHSPAVTRRRPVTGFRGYPYFLRPE